MTDMTGAALNWGRYNEGERTAIKNFMCREISTRKERLLRSQRGQRSSACGEYDTIKRKTTLKEAPCKGKT